MTRSRTKTAAAIAGALVIGSTLAGCGSGDGGENGAYCSDIKKAQTNFSTLNQGDFSNLDKAFKTFHTLADEAPDKIKSDWKTVDSGITAVEDGFKAAGLEPSDLEALQKGETPEGVDLSKLTELGSTLAKFGDAKFKTALDNIDKHAKDVCKIDINK